MSHQTGTLYALDIQKLKRGDILLSTARNSIISATIRVATLSSFSHAAILTAAGLFIEAIGPGVFHLSAARIAVRNRRVARVLRLDPEKTPNAIEIADKAANAADVMLANRYFAIGAFLSLVRPLSTQKKGAVFCSQLVSQAFAEAGLELFPGRLPSKITPGNLARCPLFRDLGDSVWQVSHAQRWIPRGIVDSGDDTRELHAAEIAAIERVRTIINDELTRRSMSTITSLWEWLAQQLPMITPNELRSELDATTAKAIEDVGIPEMPFLWKERFGASLHVDELVENGLKEKQFTEQEKADLLNFYNGQIATFRDDLKHRQIQVLAFENGYRVYGLRSLKIFAELSKEALENSQHINRAVARAVDLLSAATDRG